MKAALLSDRGVLRVSGDPARHFLHNLVTANIGTLTPGHARYAALLTPQGKIIADFQVIEAPAADGGGFFIDAPKALLADLAQKLTFYRLRAKVTIETLDGLAVLAAWDGIGQTEYGLDYRDPRLPALGQRVLIPADVAPEAAADLGAELVGEAEYEAHRIALGIPRGGVDFIYGDTFPHDADLDTLGGVDFKKGCFIGQEVVSRVEHRGTARNRIVPVEFDAHAAEAGTPVMAGDKTVGTMGSSSGNLGLAMLRVDRVADAMAAGTPLLAGGIPMRLRKGAFGNFLQDTKAAG
ncbi:YgfZ/GcvT domain-containing protein [Pseudorhodoplanes sp.]|uniref:CAF17-like 4Fe-4S cluster assembly/insertion protein YgfZ n=1 Tax=Pseudorhodoplanes sp. TaxID=1934341 RepID=UPI00391D61B2